MNFLTKKYKMRVKNKIYLEYFLKKLLGIEGILIVLTIIVVSYSSTLKKEIKIREKNIEVKKEKLEKIDEILSKPWEGRKEIEGYKNILKEKRGKIYKIIMDLTTKIEKNVLIEKITYDKGIMRLAGKVVKEKGRGIEKSVLVMERKLEEDKRIEKVVLSFFKSEEGGERGEFEYSLYLKE